MADGAVPEGAGIVRDHIYITDGGELRTIAVSPTIPPSMARSGQWRVEDFDLHKELYRGKTSLLYMATDKKSGTQVALKLYRKRKLSTLNKYQVEREIRIHVQLDHANIIKLFAAFEDEKNVYMVQEFAGGGDLFEDLKRNGGQIKEKYAVRDIIVPFLNALQYLHSLGIIHRDIKPENILLTSQKVIKIADFGLSINVTQERPVTRAGTLDYMAPEVLICPDKRRPEENKEKVLLAYTAQVDAWAVGILAYELLVGYPPFEQESRAATYQHIMYKEPKFPAWMTEDAKKFITQALCKNATQRPTISLLSKEAWIMHYAKSVERAHGRSELEVERSANSLAASASLSRAHSQASSHAALKLQGEITSSDHLSHGVLSPKSNPISPSSVSKLATNSQDKASMDQYNLSLSDPTYRSPTTPNSIGKRELKPSLSGGRSMQGSISSMVLDEDSSYSPINDSHAHGDGSAAHYSQHGRDRPSSHLKSRLGSHPTTKAGALQSNGPARVQGTSNSGADPNNLERNAGSSYYRPQSGILSDDALLPRANSTTGGALGPVPVSASMYPIAVRSNSGAVGTSRLKQERPVTGHQPEDEEDPSASKNSNSKYAKLFAKMWGGKSSATSDAEVFRVQASAGSANGLVSGSALTPTLSKGSFTSVGSLGRKVGLVRNLQEEMMMSREPSTAGRDESIAGAPTMRFKPVDPKALNAMRAANLCAEHSKPLTQHSVQFEGSSSMQRNNSDAILKIGMDRNLGRSFTSASSPTMRRLANGPMVAKIADYVAQNTPQAGM